jgi:hypothetical protein
MKRKRLRAGIMAAGLLVLLTILFLIFRAPGLPVNAITASYFDGLEKLSTNGQLSSITTPLWVTNNTGKWLNIQISEIQVHLGNVWTCYDSNIFPSSLRFPIGKGTYATGLPPHGAAFGQMAGFSPPETKPWRFKFAVSEYLTGPPYVWAGIKESLSTLVHERRFEHPFPKNRGYIGYTRSIVSAEIAATGTNATVSSR